jgi:hypothetical protein
MEEEAIYIPSKAAACADAVCMCLHAAGRPVTVDFVPPLFLPEAS